jgi:hypothetical protein
VLRKEYNLSAYVKIGLSTMCVGKKEGATGNWETLDEKNSTT